MTKEKLTYGIGINDADYKTETKVDGVYVRCPYFVRWRSMIKRCSKDYYKKRPTYKDCTVSEEWKYFSNFKEWMKTQEWENKELDKDILIEGNKHYSKETCVFVTSALNKFLCTSGKTRGKYPIGASWAKNMGKFESRCYNPFTGKKVLLGYYETPEEAHDEWRKYKHKLACDWAETIDDERIKGALVNRFK